MKAGNKRGGRRMNIYLLEDHSAERERIILYLSSEGACVRAFSTVNELLGDYAIDPIWAQGALLDIIIDRQPETGINAAHLLRKQGFRAPIVFLSSSWEYGPQTYEVEASGYLIKPATEAKVRSAFDVIVKAVHSAKAYDSADLIVKTKDGMRRILFRDIVYLESVRNNVDIHMVSGEVTAVRTTLAALSETLLTDLRFVQSHRAFLVNLDYVARLMPGVAIMMDGSKVAIAKGNTAFKSAFVRTHLKRGDNV
jgi:DNA-binding LytR/AlgR family response regulator